MADDELLAEYQRYVEKSRKTLYPLPFIIWYKQVYLKRKGEQNEDSM